MMLFHVLPALGLGLALASAAAQDRGANPPAQQPPVDARSATAILQKTLAAYQNAKSYQGDWLYLSKEGEVLTRMAVELRSKGPTKLVYHLYAAADKADKENKPASISVPEVRVVLDGKTAWFENTTQKLFYKVNLPRNALSSPLMFFPQLSTVGPAERGEDQKEAGRTIAVIFGKTKSGGLSRMEIDTATYHVVRIANDETAGFTRTLSTLTIEKEVFDGEIPDSTFAYRAPKDFKEIPAPTEAAVIFGAAPEKGPKDK